ncbi:hypothetical protein ACM66B_003805 [Microbotryomycetes sp. NB124-2]
MLDCQADRSTSAQPDEKQRRQRPKIIGIRQHVREIEASREQRDGPDSWLVRKFAVGLVVVIFGYSYYVTVVRVAIRMIQQSGPAYSGRRTQGIIYIVLYHLLFLMFIWTYAKVVFTGPGYARDYVPQSDPPVSEDAPLVHVEGYDFDRHQRVASHQSGPGFNHEKRRGTPTDPEKNVSDSAQQGAVQTRSVSMGPREDDVEGMAQSHGLAGAGGPVLANLTALVDTDKDAAATATASLSESGGQTHVASTLERPGEALGRDQTQVSRQRASRDSETRSFMHFAEPPAEYRPSNAGPLLDRATPKVPVLTADYRYDTREGFLRPLRSHRCKHCATVVLKMDHHCPWVGSCVGARNYKYFYNFLQWSSMYLVFVLVADLLALALPSGTNNFSPDAQVIVVIALAALFSLFTLSLWTAHTRLILLNMTTIEEMALARMKARERSVLTGEFGLLHPLRIWRTRKAWDHEWGRLGKEGNLWWLGSARANWEMVMGKRKLGWLLPVQARPESDDGLSYRPNPRFSPEGYLRRRSEWPRELR